MQIFVGMKSYLARAMPVVIDKISTEWIWDYYVLVAGSLSRSALAAFAVVKVLDSFYTVISYGISDAEGILISSFMGKSDIKSAKKFTRLSLALCAILSASLCIFIFVFYGQIVHLFTEDHQVVELFGSVLVVANLAVFVYCNVAVIVGIEVALNLQLSGALIRVAFLWMFGSCLILLSVEGFDMGLFGLVVSILLSFVFTNVALIVNFESRDWSVLLKSSLASQEKLKAP